MCSITGIISKDNKDVYLPLLDLLNNQKHRGNDSFGISINNKTLISNNITGITKKFLSGNKGLAHSRLAITGKGHQPLESCNKKIHLIHNGEIYNYLELKSKLSKHNFQTTMDSETILHFFEEKLSKLPIEKAIKSFMQETNGSYAVAFSYNNKFYVFRDPIGVKPLWFGQNHKYSAFASEPQVLKIIDIYFPIALMPGHLLIASSQGIEIKKIFSTEDFILTAKQSATIEQLKDSFHEAVKVRCQTEKKTGILFSGGIDSSLIAKVASAYTDITLYTVGLPQSNDLKVADSVAKELSLRLKIKELKKDELPSYIIKTLKSLNIFDRMQLDVALPEFIASELAAKDNCKIVFAGQGSDEVFCGYSLYKRILKEGGYKAVNEEIKDSLINMWSRNLYRDEIITMAHTLEIRLPFLDLNFLRHALAITPQDKIFSQNDNLRKHPLRKIAAQLGLPKQFQTMPKKAIQYGTGLSKELDKLFKT